MIFESAIIVLLAMCLDALLGELKRAHPLVLFGRYAARCEAWFYPKQPMQQQEVIFWGALCWCVAVLIPTGVLIAIYSFSPNAGQTVFGIIVLYFAIGARSLAEHGQAVAQPLITQDLLGAREQLKMIVSRDTQNLNESQISTATVETITENTHDAVIGPIFWFLVAGVPGVIVFRLANTLDAMWGYKNSRYEYFGKFSARVDDVLGWPSARLTVLLFMFAAFFKGHRQGYGRIVTWGRSWYSPNAGPVMAAGAFALGVRLGGSAMYQGVLKSRPTLGEGVPAQERHIQQAIGLMYLSMMMLVVILFVIGAIQWLY